MNQKLEEVYNELHQIHDLLSFVQQLAICDDGENRGAITFCVVLEERITRAMLTLEPEITGSKQSEN